MERKNKTILALSIIGLILVVAGASYAYFSARITGLERASTLSLTGGTLTIEYLEGNEEVSIGDVYPRDDEWLTKTFTLKGTNNTDLIMKYKVGLNIVSNGFKDNELTYDLTHEDAQSGTPIVEQTNIGIQNTVGTQWFGTGQFVNGTNVEHAYTLKIYFKDTGLDQNDSQGAVFNAKLTVADDGTEEESNSPSNPSSGGMPDGWANPTTGSLLAGIKANYPSPTAPITTPGKEVSLYLHITDTIDSYEDSEDPDPESNSTMYKFANTRAELINNPDSCDEVDGDSIVNNYYVGKYIREFYYNDSEDPGYSGEEEDSEETYEYGDYIYYVVDLHTETHTEPNDGGEICYETVEDPEDPESTYEKEVECPDNEVESDALGLMDVTNHDIPSTPEALMASTEDDYGTSYYFRGAVENNYVSFGDMCWRIVRIDGAGNIKLVLSNYNKSLSNPCSTSNDGSDMAFARVGNSYNSRFNRNYNYNTYVGYMYSNNLTSTDYLTAHANDNDSTILTFLKNWYGSAFNSSQKELLADTIWCNDKRVISDTSYDITYQNTGVNNDKTYYASWQRLVVNPIAPSLKCGESKTDNLISKFTASTSTDNGYGNGTLNGYKIGLLTADEVAFAGGATGYNTSYYLNKNASGTWWWLMTPSYFNGNAYAWGVDYFGSLYNGNNVYFSGAVRPSVSLKSTTMITGGTGTSSNPFTIE